VNLISVFRFVGSKEEIELLKIKIKNEEREVSKFILLHNTVRYDGNEYEDSDLGFIDNDPFFENYKDRIIISKSAVTTSADANEYNHKIITGNRPIELILKNKETRLLNAARNHVCSAYNLLKRLKSIEESVILISDLDESVDFSNKDKNIRLCNSIDRQRRVNRPCRILRHKFEFDFDNSWPEHTYKPKSEIDTRWIYCIPWKIVKATEGKILWDVRGQIVDPILDSKFSLAFEYTSCLSKQLLQTKLKYIEHANYIDRIQLEYFLKLNIKLSCKYFEEMAEFMNFINKDAMGLHKIVELDENTSSEYVIANIQRLKTWLIPDNYEEFRTRFRLALNKSTV